MISQLPDVDLRYPTQSPLNATTLSSSGLIGMFVKFILYGLTIVALTEFLKRQVIREQLGMKFSEDSPIEALQSLLLVLSVMALSYGLVLYKNWRPLLLLVGEFLFVSFVREQDAYLDLHYFDGAWQTIVIFSLPFPIYFAIKKRKLLFENLKVYSSLFAFGIMMSGVLTTYIFSRLYGRRTFWMAAMENGYMRDVKNISEESLETYGYLLIFIASLELVLMIQRLDLRSKQSLKKVSDKNEEYLKINKHQ